MGSGEGGDAAARPWVAAAPVAVAVTLLLPCLLAGCLDGTDGEDADAITLYAFSIKGEVLEERIIPAFREHWRGLGGGEVRFETTFAGSGRITNQVLSGAPAEVMLLSTEWDAIELQRAGLVTSDWRELPNNGTVTTSPWVVMTRAGNPRGISDMADLAADGVELVHADPLTSGGARWSVFAVYGSELLRTEAVEGAPNATAARELLAGVVGNVISWQSSARKALSQFELGYGDALVTYECEALLTRSMGRDHEVVYPWSTVMSEHKAVVVDANVDEGERELVDAFVDFLFSEAAQLSFADHGFRSMDPAVNAGHPEFQEVAAPFTVDMLGGWEAAQAELVDGLFEELRG